MLPVLNRLPLTRLRFQRPSPGRRHQLQPGWTAIFGLCLWLWLCPGAAWAQSGAQLSLFIGLYIWLSVTSLGLCYALLCFIWAKGRRWRLLPAAVELCLVAMACVLHYTIDPSDGAPLIWLLVLEVLVMVPFVTTLVLLERGRDLVIFALIGWWLVPLVFVYVGLFTVGFVDTWIRAALETAPVDAQPRVDGT
jgi:hypothetical protein